MSDKQMGFCFNVLNHNGRNGHLKSVEAFVPSRFINKAALMTTNCSGAVTHTERRFYFELIAGHGMFLNFPVFIGRV